MEKRLHYIDWLRVLAFGLLFLFHSTRFFDSYPWHIKNAEFSLLINYFVEFVHSWRMPLIFLISGTGTYFALKSKKGKFIKDRIMRLLIPFFFGVLILIPPQKYFEALFQSIFHGSYWSFYYGYPGWIVSENIGFSLVWIGHIGYHVWYLAYLLVQTLLFLPLLHAMANHKGIRFINNLSINIYILVIPLILLEFALRPLYPNYLDWADFAMYSLFFLYGFMFQINKNFIYTIEKHLLAFLSTGIICWAIYVTFKHDFDQISTPAYSWQYMSMIVFKNINTFSWVLAFLALAKKFLNFKYELLKDLNQGILPFYILHQTVLICFGYFIVQWSSPLLEKFLVIFLLSLIATIALYQIIWRIKLLRIFFGMPIRKRS